MVECLSEYVQLIVCICLYTCMCVRVCVCGTYECMQCMSVYGV